MIQILFSDLVSYSNVDQQLDHSLEVCQCHERQKAPALRYYVAVLLLDTVPSNQTTKINYRLYPTKHPYRHQQQLTEHPSERK